MPHFKPLDSTDTIQMRRRVLVLALALAAAALVFAGCSDDDDDSGGGESGDVQARYDALLEGEGFKEPASGPAPVADKSVWVLSCSQATTNCSIFADAAMEAGESLGWDMNLYDWRFDPNRFAEGTRQAIAAKADAIVTYLADCSILRPILNEAKEAGVLTAAAESLDCDPPMFDADLTYTQGDFRTWLAEWSEAQGIAVAHGTDEAAKALAVVQTDISESTELYSDPLTQGIESCDGCEVLEQVEFTTPELGPDLQQKVQQALVQNPDTNSIAFPADAYLSLGIEAALRGTGRLGDVFLGLAEGDPVVIEKLRNGEIEGAGVGISEEWEGYASIDNVNRLFNGEEPVASGIGLQVFDADNNLPASGEAYQPPIDFKAAYEESWGTD